MILVYLIVFYIHVSNCLLHGRQAFFVLKVVKGATKAPPRVLADPAPPSWVPGVRRDGIQSQNRRSLLAFVFISSRNLCFAHRSHTNTCLFVAQLSLLFVSCLYCSPFIHNSSLMIQNRLIQARSNCQTIARQSGNASSSVRSSMICISSVSDSVGCSLAPTCIVIPSFSR